MIMHDLPFLRDVIVLKGVGRCLETVMKHAKTQKFAGQLWMLWLADPLQKLRKPAS